MLNAILAACSSIPTTPTLDDATEEAHESHPHHRQAPRPCPLAPPRPFEPTPHGRKLSLSFFFLFFPFWWLTFISIQCTTTANADGANAAPSTPSRLPTSPKRSQNKSSRAWARKVSNIISFFILFVLNLVQRRRPPTSALSTISPTSNP
jgi:hypothetical protein